LEGAKDMLGLVFIILTASSIKLLLKETKIDQLIINGLSPIKGLPFSLLIFILFFVFLGISFLIPSTSALAKTLFSTLNQNFLGVGLSGVILAFSFANGFLNLLAPTSYILIAALNISKVSYEQYLKKA